MKSLIPVFMLLFSVFSYGQNHTFITGKLLGYDGRPMQMAKVHTVTFPDNFPGNRGIIVVPGCLSTLNEVIWGEVSSAGDFKITISDTGLIVVRFAGLHHIIQEVPFLIDRSMTIQVDVHLSPIIYSNNPRRVKALTAMSRFNDLAGELMVMDSTGMLTVEVETALENVKYLVSDYAKVQPQAEVYEYNVNGGYFGVSKPVNGKVKLTHAPSLGIQSDSQPRLRFSDSTSRTARFATIMWEKNQNNLAHINIILGTSLAIDKKILIRDSINSIYEVSLLKGMERESDEFIRQWMLINNVTIPSPKKDTTMVERLLKEVPPNWESWWKKSTLYMSLYGFGEYLKYGKGYFNYISEFLDACGSEETKNLFMINLLSRLERAGKWDLIKPYAALAVSKLRKQSDIEEFQQKYLPVASLVVGEAAPSFKVEVVPALQKMDNEVFNKPITVDNRATYTNETIQGKICLLHFWATWNPQSIDEIANLHTIYEKYKSKEFIILSLSLDQDADKVIRFRESKWKMPWLHSFVTLDSEILKSFQVSAPPKMFLLDKSGKIIALDAELHGDSLWKTLETVLNRR